MKYIIGTWLLKVIKVCVCVCVNDKYLLCVIFRVCLFKDLERIYKF